MHTYVFSQFKISKRRTTDTTKFAALWFLPCPPVNMHNHNSDLNGFLLCSTESYFIFKPENLYWYLAIKGKKKQKRSKQMISETKWPVWSKHHLIVSCWDWKRSRRIANTTELENLGQNFFQDRCIVYNQTIALITTVHVMKITQKMLMTRCRHVRYLF